MEKPKIAFAVLYRWRLIPGLEDAFAESWAAVTEALKNRGGLGSRLHKGEDGIYWAYAQWPSAQVREEAFKEPLTVPTVRPMSESIAERFDEIRLEVIADLLS